MLLVSNYLHADFIINFVEVEYIFEEGAPSTEVCLIGDTAIARQATARVTSVEDGTATGKKIVDYSCL